MGISVLRITRAHLVEGCFVLSLCFFLPLSLTESRAAYLNSIFDNPQKQETEGTKVDLTEEDVVSLRQWVDTAKNGLDKIPDAIRYKKSPSEKRAILIREFKKIVKDSGNKENEMLMRYVLNRASVVNDMVGPSPTNVVHDSLLSFLIKSRDLAVKFYVDDVKFLEALHGGTLSSENVELKPMAYFAQAYAFEVFQLAKTFLNPQLEYSFSRAALGWLGNDLNSPRNLERALFSSDILQIKELLDTLYPDPAKVNQSNDKCLDLINSIKYEYREKLSKHIRSQIGDLEKKTGQKLKTIEERNREEENKRKAEERRVADEAKALRENQERIVKEGEAHAKLQEVRELVNKYSLRKDSRVVDKNGNRGKIYELFLDGRAYINFDAITDSMIDITTLAFEVSEIGTLIKNTRVVSSAGVRGRVYELFSDQRVYIITDTGPDLLIHASNLTPTIN